MTESEGYEFLDHKAKFIFGFLAVILGLNRTIDQFKNVELFSLSRSIPIIPESVTVSTMYLYFVLLFTISAYSYALGYIRVDYTLSKRKVELLTYVEKLGDFFYYLTLLSPVFIIGGLLAGHFLSVILSFTRYAGLGETLVLLIVLLQIIQSLKYSIRLSETKDSDEEVRDNIGEVTTQFKKAKQTLEDNYLEASVIHLNNAVEIAVKDKLVSKFDYRKDKLENTPLPTIIDIAESEGVIERRAILEDLRALRNNAAHGKEQELDKDNLEDLFESVKEILGELGYELETS
ncbi:MAG: HEPN domain-containing protein [Candidatus Nanohalobium sp.]